MPASPQNHLWAVHYLLDVLLKAHHTDSAAYLGMPVQAARLPGLHTHMPVSPCALLRDASRVLSLLHWCAETIAYL